MCWRAMRSRLPSGARLPIAIASSWPEACPRSKTRGSRGGIKGTMHPHNRYLLAVGLLRPKPLSIIGPDAKLDCGRPLGNALRILHGSSDRFHRAMPRKTTDIRISR